MIAVFLLGCKGLGRICHVNDVIVFCLDCRFAMPLRWNYLPSFVDGGRFLGCKGLGKNMSCQLSVYPTFCCRSMRPPPHPDASDDARAEAQGA